LYPGLPHGDVPEDYAVASRLSFALWDSLPDQSLWQAAARNELHTREQIAMKRGELGVHAALLGGVGQTQRKLGHYEEAERRLRECLEIRRRELAPDDPDIVRAANNLAVALRGLEKYNEARKLLAEAESMIRSKEGQERLLVSILSNRGGIEKELGDASPAIEAYEEALAHSRLHLLGNRTRLARAHKNLAAAMLAFDRLADASEHLDSAESALGPGGTEPLLLAGILHFRMRRYI